jgi:hypothetical protein
MKDGAMVTCRVLWSLLGVVIDSRRGSEPHAPTVTPEFKPFPKLPAGITVRTFSSPEFQALPCTTDITKVLVAANKCVAHIDQYPDHGVSEEMLDRVIDVTISEIQARVHQ